MQDECLNSHHIHACGKNKIRREVKKERKVGEMKILMDGVRFVTTLFSIRSQDLVKLGTTRFMRFLDMSLVVFYFLTFVCKFPSTGIPFFYWDKPYSTFKISQAFSDFSQAGLSALSCAPLRTY